MTYEEVRQFASARPFVPYRVHTRDGKTYDVLRPHSVILTPAFVAIGIVDEAGEHLVDMPKIPLERIVNVESLGQQVVG